MVSGGDVIQMLGDILCTMERDKIPGLSGVNDSSGYKRIDKLNEIVRKSPPLKPWPLRENKDSKVSKMLRNKTYHTYKQIGR